MLPAREVHLGSPLRWHEHPADCFIWAPYTPSTASGRCRAQGGAAGADDSLAVVQETTEKMVRKQLQSRLGVDLSDRKAFIKEQVSSCQT